MQTRRSFMSILLSLIPASLLAKPVVEKCFCGKPIGHNGAEFLKPRDEEAEAFKMYYDETEINAKPVWLGKNDKHYDQFVVVATGELIDGSEVHPFTLWQPYTPEQPRWLRVHLLRGGYQGDLRGLEWAFPIDQKAYLDRELEPVQNTVPRSLAIESARMKIRERKYPSRGMVGESFKFKSDWS